MPKSHLKKKQIEQLKAKLIDEKNGLIFKTMNHTEFNNSQEQSSDEVDKANADVNNAQQLRFRNREVFYAKKIDQALARFASDEYGECLDCGATIPFERLLARPTAELCISCKEEAERDESSNFIARQSKSLGTKINLVSSLA